MQNSTAARHKHWLQFYLSELFQRALQMLPHLNKMTRVQCNGIFHWWRDSSPETSGFSNILALRTHRQILIVIEIISVGFRSRETFLPRGNFQARSRTSLALISLTDFGSTRSLTGISSTKTTFFPPRGFFLARSYFQAVSRNSHILLSLRKMR